MKISILHIVEYSGFKNLLRVTSKFWI